MSVPDRFTGSYRTLGAGAPSVRCASASAGVPVRRVPPVRCRPMPLCRQSGFCWPKPLHVARPPSLLIQVTLNSLCSTHRLKDNNFCSTLYIVGALFDLFMWDIS